VLKQSVSTSASLLVQQRSVCTPVVPEGGGTRKGATLVVKRSGTSGVPQGMSIFSVLCINITFCSGINLSLFRICFQKITAPLEK